MYDDVKCHPPLMAATSPLQSPLKFFSNSTTGAPKLSFLLPVNPSEAKCLTNRSISIRCDNLPQNSIGFLSGTDLIPSMQSSPLSLSSSVSMAAASGSDSASKNVKRVCLFYCDETRALAERIAAQSDAIELRSISWR